MARVRSIRAVAALAAMVAVGAVSVTPTVAQSPNPKPFAGKTVYILSFNGPQVGEPLIRRHKAFEDLTGATVNVVLVPFQSIYTTAFADAATKTNSFDGYVFDPQWLGDFVAPGYLADLTDRVKNDPAIQWDDIGPFFRDFSATYDNKTYTIPLDGDFHMVYYRSDLIDKPPATWDEYLAIAKQFNGKDLNGDGQPDYGSCIAKKKGAQGYWWIISVAAGLLQSQGTGQGAFFNNDTMDPLFNNEAFAKALDTYKATGQYGPPEELKQDVGDSRSLFKTGRCALTMDWGDIGTLVLGQYAQDKTGAVITPGWTQVLDRATNKLVDCDATTCPKMVDGVNHAPFASFGGWSGAVNAASKNQDVAYAFLSYMSQPAQANEDVTIGASGYNPYRLSQFQNLDLWEKAGMSEAAATNYLGAIGASLQSPNMVLDLRIPKTKQYQQDILDVAVAQFLAGELNTQETMDQITAGWNEITDTEGRDAQLAAYNASLGVKR